MSEIRIRVEQEPVGGARIAWAYLASVVGLVLGGLFWAIWAPFDTMACGDGEDVLCLVGWAMAGAIIGPVLGLVLGAFVFRLGWEWWLVVAALALSAPLWFGWVPVVAQVLILVLAPALAAAATWSGPRRPVWRPWAIGVASGLFIVLGALSILV